MTKQWSQKEQTIDKNSPEVSVVLPCLNEAETLAFCINEIRETTQAAGLHCEIIVSDNGSSDRSLEIAKSLNVKIVHASPKGYGVALRAGIDAASAPYVIMADSDGSYNFGDIPKILEKLRNGSDLVVGNRFIGGIQPGAMPWSHRWIGNPVLSFLGRFLFRCPVRDFHCGLRGICKSSFEKLGIRSTGMEFASEMIVRSALAGLNIAEVPTSLRPDGRSRRPHLRSVPDGWRHLKFLFLLCPRWLFSVPGWALVFAGVAVQLLLMSGDSVVVSGVHFSLNTSLAAAATIFLGLQLVGSGFVIERTANILRSNEMRFSPEMRIERGLLIGFGIASVGAALFAWTLLRWAASKFGDLPIVLAIQFTIPSVILMTVGSQVVVATLFLASLELFMPILAEGDGTCAVSGRVSDE